MKIIDYSLAQNTEHYTLRDRVMKLMEDGWQPFGGVSLRHDGITVQAMVKYDTSVEEEVAAQINDIHTTCVISLPEWMS